MKHKHADLIHAWADGAEIQVKCYSSWMYEQNPSWDVNLEYRIKPEEKKPVVRWLWAYKIGSEWRVTDQFYDEEEISRLGTFKLEWSRTEFPE